MSAHLIAGQPAVLSDVAAVLGEAAAGLPLTRGAAVSVGDGAADAAVHEFSSRWSEHLRDLGEVMAVTGRQARLTAIAFRLAGG